MSFDAAFLTRLRRRDPEACASFVTQFRPVIDSRLRRRFRDRASIEDARQETFCRVFRLVDADRVREPAQLGSFVWGVCDRVAHETHRTTRFHDPLGGQELVDPHPGVEGQAARNEMHTIIRRGLSRLRETDRQILIEIHFEERDRAAMAKERQVTVTGLNVQLCRATKRLRTHVLNDIRERHGQPVGYH